MVYQLMHSGANLLILPAFPRSARWPWGAPEVPYELQDSAFDRHVDLLVLGQAWDELDPALIADVALQLAEGERILLRPHKAIKSEDLFKLAARMATDKRDQATLDRLQKHYERTGNQPMSDSLAAARKLAGEARAEDPALLIPVDEVTPEGYALYRGVLGQIRAARYVGNRQTLEELKEQLGGLPGLTDKQKEYLRSIMGTSHAELEGGEALDIGDQLEKLLVATRQFGGRWPPVSVPKPSWPSKPPSVPNYPGLDPSNIPGVGQNYTRVYIKNNSGRHIRVAINYIPRTGYQNRPEGWWHFSPGEKAYVVDANGSAGFFAETVDRGTYRWWGAGRLPSTRSNLSQLPYDFTMLPRGRLHQYTHSFDP